jgi:ubiquinone/menaquinone biosynthesis C-methylase UbiE
VDQDTKGVQAKPHIYDSSLGYALAAPAYDSWHWSRFWRQNEAPIVRRWATALSAGAILDAGSGTGVYRPILENEGHQVVAADLSAEMLAVQLRKFPKAFVVQARIEALPLRASLFDYILCTRVLSHIEILGPVFREFARVTKPAAKVLITDVHPDHRYSEMSIPTDGDRVSIETYKHPISGIKQALRSNGFELTEFRELHFQDLAWKPPIEDFENIYADLQRPISYVATLRRP